jgi:hypothetical protein
MALRTPGEAGRPSVAEMRKTLRGAFDEAYYLARYADVRDAGVDPLRHYLLYGAGEERDPCLNFSTSHYLEEHADVRASGVNPFYHWVATGRVRAAVSAAAGEYVKSRRHGPAPVGPVTREEPERRSVEELAREILEAVQAAGGKLVLSFGHDNYLEVVGGVQLCTVLEQEACCSSGRAYLQLHPAVRSDRLLDDAGAGEQILGAVLNGRDAGRCRVADLERILAALSGRAGGLSVTLIIHSLLGHSLKFIAGLKEILRVSEAGFWLHDFSSLCPSIHLLRNGIVYCGVPPEGSSECDGCLHGEERRRHLEKLRQLFSAYPLTVLAPSEAALELWLSRSSLPHARTRVLGHARLIVEGSRTALPQGRLRVAFLGYPVFHKGWDAFANLALRRDDRYAFYLLSAFQPPYPPVEWRKVEVGAGHVDAMSQALSRERIDVAVLWSQCPETFSFTAHEALAAGVFIVTTEHSGNIASLVRATGQGLVLHDEWELHETFRSGRLVEALGKALSGGLPRGSLRYGGMTVEALPMTDHHEE